MLRAQPRYLKPRHACPFLNFVKKGDKILPSNENVCCLNSGKPCLMLAMKKIPRWMKCGFRDQANAKKITAMNVDCVIFPEEFNRGISLNTWIKHVLNDKLPRP